MKFLVQCPELRGAASQKSLKYDITKGQTLEQHIANIHRSLELVGVELTRAPTCYGLQVADRKGEPIVMESGAPCVFESGLVDAHLQTIAEFAKRQRLRDLSVLLIPTPRVRATELIAGLSNNDTVKESAYKLRSCLQEEQLLNHFVDRDGLSKLLEVLPSCKGNALSYTIAALHTTLSSSSPALAEFVQKHGSTAVPMIYGLLSGAQVLSASRFVVDVLRLALSVEGGYSLVEEAAKKAPDNLFSPMVSILLSEDLHSRLSGMKFITTALEQAPPDARPEIVEELRQQSIAEAMQESVWIKHSDIRAELDKFERVSGITLDRTSALIIPEGTEDELKDKIRELANQLMFLKGELHSARAERDENESKAAGRDSEASAAVEDVKSALNDEELERIKDEVREEGAKAVECLQRELREARALIADQEEKICSLKHTTGMLVSDSSLGEEDRRTLMSSLSKVPVDEKAEKIEQKEEKEDTKSAEAADPEALKQERSSLEDEVEVLRKELSGVTIETYQSRLKLTQINEELEQLTAQRQKVQQVVSSLEQKNVSLRESMAEMEQNVAEAKQEVKRLKKKGAVEMAKLKKLKEKQDEKHASLRGADELLSYEEMQQKVSKMEQLVMVTSREKKDFQKEINELKAKVEELQTGEP